MTNHWDGLPHTDLSDDQVESTRDGFNPENPVHIGMAFITAVANLDIDTLEVLVTPESRDSWSDFAEAKALLDSIEDWGVGSRAEPSVDSADVVYVKVLRHVTSSFRVDADDIVMIPAVVTVVRHPSLGRWAVQQFGDFWRPTA